MGQWYLVEVSIFARYIQGFSKLIKSLLKFWFYYSFVANQKNFEYKKELF